MYLTIKPRLARKSTSQSLVDYDTNERLKGEWTCTSWGSYSVATGWTTKGRGSTCKLNLTIIILFHSWVQEYIFVHLIKTRTILLSAMLWPPSGILTLQNNLLASSSCCRSVIGHIHEVTWYLSDLNCLSEGCHTVCALSFLYCHGESLRRCDSALTMQLCAVNFYMPLPGG